MEKYKYYLLSVLYSLILPLHILNSITIGNVKLFYIPTAILTICGIFELPILLSRNKFIKYFFFFVATSLISIIYQLRYEGYLVLICIFLSMLPLINMKKHLLFTFTPILFLISLFLSYNLSSYSNLNYRYQGMYNDPNYFVISILLGIFFCTQSLKQENNKLFKILNIIIITYAGYNILLTQSRGGIIGFIVFLIILTFQFFKQNIRNTIITIIVIIMGGLILTNSEIFTPTQKRFAGENKNDESSALSRITEINSAIDGMKTAPVIFFTGIGIGGTGHREYTDSYIYANSLRIHNTLIAVLFEQGFWGFIIFLILLIKIIKKTYEDKDKIYLGLCLAVIIQSLTIWTITYLPFWYALTFCMDTTKE